MREEWLRVTKILYIWRDFRTTLIRLGTTKLSESCVAARIGIFGSELLGNFEVRSDFNKV